MGHKKWKITTNLGPYYSTWMILGLKSEKIDVYTKRFAITLGNDHNTNNGS